MQIAEEFELVKNLTTQGLAMLFCRMCHHRQANGHYQVNILNVKLQLNEVSLKLLCKHH